MDDCTVRKTCLNGWWDFKPGTNPNPPPVVPQTGWLNGQYLVPSFWTKPHHGVRKRGDIFYDALRDPALYETDEYEFLFDAFGYPPAWSQSRAAWVRRTLTLNSVKPDRLYKLIVEAVMPKAHLFINGQHICTHIHPTLPMEADISGFLHEGDNEIVMQIDDYDYDEDGRALVPTGNLIPCEHSGVWQNVWLVETADVSVRDIVIRTSTREHTLTAIFEITNHTDQDRDVTLAPVIYDWQKDSEPDLEHMVLTLPEITLSVSAGTTTQAEISVEWLDAEWWSPENPKLYWLESTLLQDVTPIEKSYERFGFREVWIEGPDIMLNDHPVHLFSDWGHKSTPYYYTEGWIRQWFRMIRDANMNHSRLHTHPHPPIVLDIADEEGILITGEAGLHGSGGAQAARSPAYWEAAADHVRRFVQRDKNHPSIILWSVENEMRWNTKGQDAAVENAFIRRELPKLRDLFARLDPTRTAYHDGDSSLWNEKTQPIISRHYGKETAGIGWWDRTRPLHSGEMALYHYAGPNTTLHLGGDAVYASFEAIDKVAAQDAALIIETGRTLGVSCFGPWNLSCLENLRMERQDIHLDYADFTVPGVKPLQVPAHSSEFSFWQTGKGYTPNHSFDIQKHAFRPLAVIDRSLKSGYFAGQSFQRDLFIVNDTTADIKGTLSLSLKHKDRTLGFKNYDISIKRGRITPIIFNVLLPDNTPPGNYEYHASFSVNGKTLDAWTRQIKISTSLLHPEHPASLTSGDLVVYGSGTLQPILDALGYIHTYIDELDALALSNAKVLILEKNTVLPGSTQNQAARSFVQNGGRVLVMEQTYSLFPALPLEEKPVLKAFIRAYDSPVLQGLAEDDLAFWGGAPYPLLAGDTYVAKAMYRKDDGTLMLPILDSGEGGFGSGNMDYTPLFEAREGDGLILACQMRISDKIPDTPAAERLFANLLQRAIEFKPDQTSGAIEVEGNLTAGLHEFYTLASEGKTVIVNNATPQALHAWSTLLDIALHPYDVGDVYQIVRTKNDPVLSGVNNEDTCGIETFSYTPTSAANNLVGETYIKPVQGLEALLVTPTESCLRELMVYDGRTEALRTHTLSRVLYGEKRQSAVALGSVKIGKGAVIFNQFAPPDGVRKRFSRLRNRLLANHGTQFDGSLLEGDATPASQPTSPGYPQRIYVYNGNCDAGLRQQFIESTLPSLERMLSMPILTVTAWSTITSAEGIFTTADMNLDQDIYLYYPVWSPSARKNIETNLEVPNPEALTFLDMEGTGYVEVTINGQTTAPLLMGDAVETISDIALEIGGNHVLIHWQPGEGTASLKMRWRNIMRQPEVGLTFGEGGSAN